MTVKYCLNCKTTVEPQKSFNAIICFLLFAAWIIPGIIYLIYYSSKEPQCPFCKGRAWGSQEQVTSQATFQTQAPKLNSKAKIYCPSCGEKFSDNNQDFCQYCGAKL